MKQEQLDEDDFFISNTTDANYAFLLSIKHFSQKNGHLWTRHYLDWEYWLNYLKSHKYREYRQNNSSKPYIFQFIKIVEFSS